MTPDPPPPGVPAIEPDIRGAVTVREQLTQHRSVESCARCHVKIDPPGVALENFDVVGGWREKYRVIDPDRKTDRVRYTPDAAPPLRYEEGLPVDASDLLDDGRRFDDIRSFKKLLLADPEQIARTIATKLIVYATGAPVGFADRDEVAKIVTATQENDYGLRSLINAVTQSKLFHTR